MKVIFEKKNSSFANIKSYLDTHLRVVHVVLIASEESYFLGDFFSTSDHFRPKFVQPQIKGDLEEMELWVQKYKIIF